MVVAKVTQPRQFVDLYPVNLQRLPMVVGYRLETSLDDVTAIGWKFAYQTRRKLGGHAIWSEQHLVIEAEIGLEQVNTLLRDLWREGGDEYRTIRSIAGDRDWQPSAQTIADFVALGLASDLEKPIRSMLRKERSYLNNAYVERVHEIKGWVVGGSPAISIAVSSDLISQFTLRDYIQRSNSIDDVIGLMVKDKLGNYSGAITEILGELEGQRDTIIARATREEMKDLIRKASGDDLVIKVKRLHNSGYDYIGSAVQIIVRNQDWERLGIDGSTALSRLQIPAAKRSQTTRLIAELLHKDGLIQGDPYDSASINDHFTVFGEKDLGIKARLGDGYLCAANPQTVLSMLRSHPVYQRSSTLPIGTTMRIGVLNLVGDHSQGKSFLADIQKQLHDISFPVEWVGSKRVNPASQSELEMALEALFEQNPHIILPILPGEPNNEDDESSLYLTIKKYTVPRSMVTQVIYERTLGNSYALNNIILGILCKTGNIPYVLAQPLLYTDLVVGIDIARKRTTRRQGSMSMVAMTRIYAANGDFLRYFVSDGAIEGETLTKSIIRQLFPVKYFSGKRVVVHRDGLFRGSERRLFKEWGLEIGATFYLIEVIKSGVPRMYLETFNGVERPQRGSTFFVNDLEAIVVSALPPHKNGTPRPLLIRTDEQLPITDAVHSVFALTYLHHGSTLPPRLPISIHYSDSIGYLLLRGVKPEKLDGSWAFWL
jgi:hypothetical protein